MPKTSVVRINGNVEIWSEGVWDHGTVRWYQKVTVDGKDASNPAAGASTCEPDPKLEHGPFTAACEVGSVMRDLYMKGVRTFNLDCLNFNSQVFAKVTIQVETDLIRAEDGNGRLLYEAIRVSNEIDRKRMPSFIDEADKENAVDSAGFFGSHRFVQVI